VANQRKKNTLKSTFSDQAVADYKIMGKFV